MRRVSVKRAAEARIYMKRRAVFLDDNPQCQWPNECQNAASEIHHKRGRVGALYLDVSTWLAICSPHHRWTTENPRAAVELGVSQRRVGAA